MRRIEQTPKHNRVDRVAHEVPHIAPFIDGAVDGLAVRIVKTLRHGTGRPRRPGWKASRCAYKLRRSGRHGIRPRRAHRLADEWPSGAASALSSTSSSETYDRSWSHGCCRSVAYRVRRGGSASSHGPAAGR